MPHGKYTKRTTIGKKGIAQMPKGSVPPWAPNQPEPSAREDRRAKAKELKKRGIQ
jgi:hypothetical protein